MLAALARCRSILLVAAVLGAPADAQKSLPDPRALFETHCATCHGKEGKGDGPAAAGLDPKPRDLTSGRFSFGNTSDAIAKTIEAGIPPAMPGFGAALSQREREALARFVLELGPERVESPPRRSRMSVGSRARVVRGYLPARHADERPLGRGLVVGLPGGLSFVYRTDDVRLLEVRRGKFVDRTDWVNRGGSPLALLGEPFWRNAGGDPPPAFADARSGAALRARLSASWTRNGRAGLEIELVDRRAIVWARLAQEPREVAIAGGYGFVLELRALQAPAECKLRVRLGSWPPAAAAAPPASGRADGITLRVRPLEAEAPMFEWLVVQDRSGGTAARTEDGTLIVKGWRPAAGGLRFAVVHTRRRDDRTAGRILEEVAR